MKDSQSQLIMVVDDNKHLLITLEDFLKYSGFDVVTAESGEDALSRIEKSKRKPDLIILDISMPGIGGVGFLKRISDSGGKTMYPVLVLTARSAMEEFFGTLDVEGFLAKPCPETTLLNKINEILARKAIHSIKSTRKRPLILLGEDDASLALETEEAFDRAGYDIQVARSGADLLEKANVFKPDLILSKEIMSGMNGSVAAALIHKNPQMESVPIVIYDETLTDEETAKFKLRSSESVASILKTADITALLQATREILE